MHSHAFRSMYSLDNRVQSDVSPAKTPRQRAAATPHTRLRLPPATYKAQQAQALAQIEQAQQAVPVPPPFRDGGAGAASSLVGRAVVDEGRGPCEGSPPLVVAILPLADEYAASLAGGLSPLK